MAQTNTQTHRPDGTNTNNQKSNQTNSHTDPNRHTKAHDRTVKQARKKRTIAPSSRDSRQATRDRPSTRTQAYVLRGIVVSFKVLRVLHGTAEPLMVRASAGESFKVLRVLSSVRLRGYERRSRLCGKLAQLPLVGQHLHIKQATSKQTNKQTNRQTNTQANKLASKQTSRRKRSIERQTEPKTYGT